jgi:hypothetical protein
MLLSKVRARLTGDDRGSALIVVIGIGAAMAIMGVTLVSVSSFATSQSSSTRAVIQAQASAESSLDRTLDQLRTSAVRGAEATFPCEITYDDTTGAGMARTTVSIVYQGEGQAAPLCPQPSTIELTAAELTATTVVTFNTADGQRTQTRTVKQKATVEDLPPSTPLFFHGLYSGNNLNLTNTFQLNGGAGAYTNGPFNCNSSSAVWGSVTSIGNAYMTNSCTANSIWTGGTFKCDSNPIVNGDVLASGTGLSSTSNTCKITGSLTVGGSLQMKNTSKVLGNVISSTGSVSAGTDVRVTGYGRAGSTISVDGSGSLAAIFANGTVPNAPSAVPAPPTVEAQPQIFWSDVAPSGTNVVLATAWIKQNAIANGAHSYNDTYKGTTCTAARPDWSMNGPLNSPTVATVIDARASTGGCPSGGLTLQGNNASDPMVVNLYNDLTLVVDSFQATNGLHIVSKMPAGQTPKFRVIVVVPAGSPAPTPGVAPTCTSGGSISSSGSTVIDSSVDSFFYTNGQVTFSNVVNITGSVYACTSAFANGTTITYADMTPPAMTGPSDPHYAFAPTTRYNVGTGVG